MRNLNEQWVEEIDWHRHLVKLSNGIMFTLGMMFDHYTWEDGTPFGEVE